MHLKTALAPTLAALALAVACSSTSTAPDASASDAAAPDASASDAAPPRDGSPGDTIMSAAGYDRTCAANQDCDTVLEGNVCGCGCNYAALNKAAAAKFAVDSVAKRANCKEIFTCAPCPSVEVACVASACQVVKDAGAGDASADATRD